MINKMKDNNKIPQVNNLNYFIYCTFIFIICAFDNIQHNTKDSFCMSTQTIINQTPEYELRVSLKDNILIIELQIMKSPPKFYIRKFTNQSIPPNLLQHFCDVALMFQCFKFPYKVDLRDPAIRIQAEYQFKCKKIIKQGMISLEERDFSDMQKIKKRLTYLVNDIEKLKNSGSQVKFNINNKSEVKIEHNKQQWPKGETFMKELIGLEKGLNQINEYFQQVQEKAIDLIKSTNQKINSIRQDNKRNKQDISRFQEYIEQDNSDKYQQEDSQPDCQILVSSQVKIVEAEHRQARKNRLIPLKIKKQSISSNTKQALITRYIVSLPKPGILNFQVQNNRITHIGQSNKRNQITLQHYMKIFTNNQYKIKILKSEDNNIYIGVIERNMAKLKRSYHVICYFGIDGEIWDDKPCESQGNGFKQGDQVQVLLNYGQIQWYVNGQLQAKHRTDKLQNPNKIYVPMIEMGTKGDRIQWIN